MSSFKVAIYQYAARDEHPDDRISRLGTYLAELSGQGVDLIVCPELFLSGYGSGENIEVWRESRGGRFGASISALASSSGIAIAYGYPEVSEGACYNSAALYDKTGTLIANHRKLRLPTAHERKHFSAGGGYSVATLGGLTVGILVCYDVEFPETVRACAQAGAQLVIVPTALTSAWGVVARQLVPTRAFENNIFVAYANYAGSEGGMEYLGSSCVVGPDGADLARAGAGEEVIIASVNVEDIDRLRGRLPYLTDCKDLSDLPATHMS